MQTNCDSNFNHYSVLLDECIENLNIKPNGIYLDCTLGGGGHTKKILENLNDGKLIAFDKDIDAINECQKLNDSRLSIIKSDFKNACEHLNKNNINHIDGYLIDLGMSSYQIDKKERGFTYMSDAPLDMRMDQEQSFSAKNIINGYSYEALVKLLYEYGQETFSKQIARAIETKRKEKPIETTFELVEVIDQAIPRKFKSKGHCAKKTFQAVRIAVNKELTGLYDFVIKITDKLAPGGRGCVITFHSLEDKIIKSANTYMSLGCICENKKLPCNCGKEQKVILVNKKPILPTDKEIKDNSRSKSAKLRVIEKL